MSITWLSQKQKDGVATFLENSITLNSVSLTPLKEYLYVMVGIDEANQEILIKPIDFNLANRGDKDKNLLYKLTLTRSYGRITNKLIIEEINHVLNINVIGKKFKTNWDSKNNYLVVKLKEKVEL